MIWEFLKNRDERPVPIQNAKPQTLSPAGGFHVREGEGPSGDGFKA